MLSKLGKMVFDTKMQLAVLTGMFSLCCITPNIVQAIPLSDISAVYFFGDSLTDSGFNNTYNQSVYAAAYNPPTNKATTFTTFGEPQYPGYVWSQYLAHDITGVMLPPTTTNYPYLSDQMTNNTTPIYTANPPPGEPIVFPVLLNPNNFNYACGGARTDAEPGIDLFWAPSVAHQVQNYLNNHAPQPPAKLDPKALYAIWSGANDILYGIETFPTPQQAPKFMALIDQTTTQIVNLVAQLSERGARRFLVMSLPNIGSTPFVLSLGPAAEKNVKNLSFIFNTLLNQKLGRFLKQHPNVKILYFDAYLALDNLIQHAKNGEPTRVDGQEFYFGNYTDPVCPEPLSIYCTVPYNQNNINYLFADSVHPSGLAHHVLALEVERQIKLWK